VVLQKQSRRREQRRPYGGARDLTSTAQQPATTNSDNAVLQRCITWDGAGDQRPEQRSFVAGVPTTFNGEWANAVLQRCTYTWDDAGINTWNNS
jgi:hypothetical protein